MRHPQLIRTIPLKRTQYKTLGYLEENEMQVLLNTVDFNTRTGVWDKALLLLLYNTGARVSEIVGLKVADLRLDGVLKSISWGRATSITIVLCGPKRLKLYRIISRSA